ncbi:MAG: integrase family protein [Azonexus sp.]|nr:integrase family protein [Azonexus sp.]MBP8168199.1 integrase family protein [Azonexus sp.]
MARINLTAGRIRDFATDKGQAFLWDSDTPGLAVRATAPGQRNPEGSKAFIFQGKQASGQDVRITIGDVRSWGIDKAREEARTLQKLIDKGIDPRQEKKERVAATEAKRARSEREEAPALDAWSAYLESRRPKWGERTYADHQRFADAGGKPKARGRKKGEGAKTEPGALHVLLRRPLNEIDSALVSQWMRDEVAKRPTNTALAYRLLRAFINWCADHKDYQEQVNADACATRSVRDELPKKAAKDDCMQREQLPLWFEHVRKLPNPVHAAYLQTLLITGARREELAWLKWEDVDFQWKGLTIRDKVDGERTIPLTPYVSSLLAQLPRRKMMANGKEVPNPWVFSSPTAASGRLQEPRIAHNKVLTAAGLPALSLHGLRRSFGTLTEWVEVPAGIVAQIMGHKPSATAEKHYRVRPLDLLRMWHTKIEGWILEQAGIEQPSEEAKPGLRVINA